MSCINSDSNNKPNVHCICIHNFGESNRSGKIYMNPTKERNENTMKENNNKNTGDRNTKSMEENIHHDPKNFDDWMKSLNPELITPMFNKHNHKCDHADNTKPQCLQCKINPDFNLCNITDEDSPIEHGFIKFMEMLFQDAGKKTDTEEEEDQNDDTDTDPLAFTNSILMHIGNNINEIKYCINKNTITEGEMLTAEPISTFPGLNEILFDYLDKKIKLEVKHRVKKEMKKQISQLPKMNPPKI